MDERLAKRLLMLALVTFTALGAMSMLLYAGLVFYRDIFEKVLFMIMPPLLSALAWSENRNNRTRLGLPSDRISPYQVLLATSGILCYMLAVYFLYDRFESLIVIAPVLLVFSYIYWAGTKTRREFAMKKDT